MGRDELDLYALPDPWWSETTKMVDEGYEKFWAKRGGRPTRAFEFGKKPNKEEEDEEDEDRSA